MPETVDPRIGWPKLVSNGGRESRSVTPAVGDSQVVARVNRIIDIISFWFDVIGVIIAPFYKLKLDAEKFG